MLKNAWHDFDKLKQEKIQPVQSLKLVLLRSNCVEGAITTSQ